MAMGGGDLDSFSFSILPPSSAVCAVSYIISTTSSDGNIISDITVEADPYGGPVQATGTGFKLCINTYNFTVAVVTRNGSRIRSGIFSHSPMDVLRK